MSGANPPTGHQDLLDELWQTLRPDAPSTQKTVVLHGQAGVGKSHLALHFSHIHEEEFSDLIWLDASSELILQNGMADNLLRLTTLGVAKTECIEENAEDFVRWLERENNDKWLLIFDAYDRAQGGEEYNISKYIPDANHGSIIITSRDSQLDMGHSLAVEKLSLDNAVTLLAQHAMLDIESFEKISSECPDLVQIARELDRLPAYMDLYAQTKGDNQCGSALATAIAISYQEIRCAAPRSANMLHLFACYYTEGIWYDLLRDVYDENNQIFWIAETTWARDTYNATVEPLVGYRLLEPRPFRSAYVIRRPVRDWLLNDLTQSERKSLMEIVIKSIGCNVPFQNELGTQLFEHILLRQADYIFNDIKQDKILWETSNLGGPFIGLGDLYFKAWRLPEAELMYTVARGIYIRSDGPKAVATLETLYELGKVYGRQNRFEDSENAFLQALDGFKRAVGSDDLHVFQVQDAIGGIYRPQGLAQKAEDMFQQALTGYMKALGPFNNPTLCSLDNLVHLHMGEQRFGDAARLLERRLANCRVLFTPESVSITNDIKQLSIYYQSGTECPEERALERQVRTTAHCLPKLFLYYESKSDSTEKVNPEKQVHSKTLTSPQPPHIISYKIIHTIGVCYLYDGKLDQARDALWEAVAGKETFLGVDDYITNQSLYFLGIVFERQGFLPGAESLWQRVIDSLSGLSGYEERQVLERARFRLENLRGFMIENKPVNEGLAVEDMVEDIQGLRIGNRASRL
ncbi:hypothetical protein BDV12DRAFT_194295 [Aspergillus spectabilis]